MALFGSIATVRKQVPPEPAFAAAFAYLDEVFRPESSATARIRALAIGDTHRVELDGGSFALEQVYRTKPRADGAFESHRNYVDVQVIVEGEELMEVTGLNRCIVAQDYSAERDVSFFKDVRGTSGLHLRVGDAAIFFPADAHMPGLHGPAGPMLVRKTVVKVPVGA